MPVAPAVPRALFYPKSVAVIGASTDPGSVGNEITKNIIKQGYRGRILLVNPKGGNLYGRKVLTSLEDTKESIDLAIIAIPAKFVLGAIKDLLKYKIKAVIVISAGFREVGNLEGETELAKLCEDNEVALIGPNCLGLINAEIKLNASFAPLMPMAGPVAFVSQSGAICASVLDYARQRGIGFSKFISVGNKALVGEVELLEYLYSDSKTKVIAMYVEEFRESQKLRQIARKITRGKPAKPIIILKSGRTQAGQKAAMSHTGSLGSSDQAYGALFAQTGIIRADGIDELFDFVECFARNHELKNNRVAVITNAGGPGVLTADALAQDGLRLAEITAETRQKLLAFLPPAASIKNPIDILGDANADRYHRTLNAILNDSQVDAVQIILTPQSMTEVEATARAIVAAKRHSAKPVVVTFMGQELVEEGLDILYDNKVATAAFPDEGARALGALQRFKQWLLPKKAKPSAYANIHPEKVRKILKKYTLTTHRQLLHTEDVFNILRAYGFPLVKHWIATTKRDVEDIAYDLNQPVAVKIISPQISHKSDVGGVKLDVEPKELVKTYQEMLKHLQKIRPKAELKGVEIMPMVTDDGIEIILGTTTDPQLGKQVLVGLGGIYAEALQDVAWGLAPLSKTDIQAMIDSLKTAKILAGIRGHGPLATHVLVECIGRLSQLVTDFPEINEIDINPLKVLDHKKGAVVLDARMVIEVPSKLEEKKK